MNHVYWLYKIKSHNVTSRYVGIYLPCMTWLVMDPLADLDSVHPVCKDIGQTVKLLVMQMRG
jgi:hypothetical protein